MITDTKRAFVVAALILATGIAGVELSRGTAQAEEAASYTTTRIDTAFDVVAEMPAVDPVSVPVATKGDLPVPLDCVRFPVDAQADCTDLAYRALTEPSVIVATSFGNTTTLLRVDAIAVADVVDRAFRRGG